MPNSAVGEHGDIGRAAADIDQAHAELAFVVRQHGVTRRELLEDDVLDLQPAAFDALLDVLRGVDGARHQVDLRLEPHARHAERFANAFLVIDQVFLRQDVQHFLVRGNRHRLRRIDDALDVLREHFPSRIATMPWEFRLRTWLPAMPA